MERIKLFSQILLLEIGLPALLPMRTEICFKQTDLMNIFGISLSISTSTTAEMEIKIKLTCQKGIIRSTNQD